VGDQGGGKITKFSGPWVRCNQNRKKRKGKKVVATPWETQLRNLYKWEKINGGGKNLRRGRKRKSKGKKSGGGKYRLGFF